MLISRIAATAVAGIRFSGPVEAFVVPGSIVWRSDAVASGNGLGAAGGAASGVRGCCSRSALRMDASAEGDSLIDCCR